MNDEQRLADRAAIESPNGELGFYVVSDGSGVAYRARTRPPSYIHFAIFPHLIVGHQLSDVVAVLGSLDRNADATTLLDWGFAQRAYLKPGDPDSVPSPAPACGAPAS